MWTYRGIRFRVIAEGCYYTILFPDFIEHHETNDMGCPTDDYIKKYIDKKYKEMLEPENDSNIEIQKL